MSKLPALNIETIQAIIDEKIEDNTVNQLVWYYLGYRYDYATCKWDISRVAPEWREEYPDPPNFIEFRPPTVKLTCLLYTSDAADDQ